MQTLTEDKTAIMISHRLSSCRFSDRILVLEDDQISENGSHQEFLTCQDFYYRMWQEQTQYGSYRLKFVLSLKGGKHMIHKVKIDYMPD